jgi:hypothetical protein
LLTILGIGSTLDDAKQGLVIRILVRFDAAVQPARRPFKRLFDISLIRRPGRAFVKGHDDVRAEVILDFDRFFPASDVARTIDVRLEPDAFFCDVAPVRQGKNLETTTVGQNRPIPVHEPVQATGLTDNVAADASRVDKYWTG